MKKSEYRLWKNRIERPYEAFLLERQADYQPDRRETLPADYCMAVKASGKLHEHAESLIAEWIAKQSGPDFIYCDEDCIDEKTGERSHPFLKPEWSPDTLESFFYPGGLVVMKRELVERAVRESGMACDFQSPDFLYECAVRAEAVSHLPLILYHSYEVCGYQYKRKHHATDRLQTVPYDRTQKISIVILSKDNPSMLERCVSSIRKYSGEAVTELIVIDNGSSRENTGKAEALSERFDFYYERIPMDFLYSSLCNIGASKASGSFLLFMNDDVEVPCENDFLLKMLEKASDPHTGAVGVKLLYPESGRIQHVGITDLAVGPSHKLATFLDDSDYYYGRNRYTYNVLAVTGACLMVEKQKFDEIGGFDEALYVSYTDVDLCTDLLERGYRNVVLNDIFLYHHESVSRGNDILDDAKRRRMNRERDYYYGKHPFLKEKGDPYYHRNLTPWKLEYEPDVLMPWEDIRQMAEPVEGRRICDAGPSVCASVDSVRQTPDYYEAEGWIFRKQRSGLRYEPGVVLLADGREVCYTAVRRYRKELPEVFPGERQIDLSGFICRIPRQNIEDVRSAGIEACLYPMHSRKCYAKRESLKGVIDG